MQILEFFRNLFSRNKSKVNTIVNKSIYIPNRDNFKDNPDKLNKIDEYKKEYLEIIRSKKYIVSTNLSSEYLQTERKINIELLLNHYLNNKELNSTKVFIQILKMILCQNKLEEIETEVITRLIALKEIYESRKYFLSPSKRSAILNEINNLSSTYYDITFQKYGIYFEMDAYLKENASNDELDKKYLNARRKTLIEIAKEVMPEKLEEIIGLKLRSEAEVAYIERELEIYAITHKDDLYKLIEILHLLDIVEKDFNSYDELLEKINKLELRYNIFYEFGRNIVTEEEMYNLYRVKFDILTLDIVQTRKSPVNHKTKEKELEVYKQIIMQKIEVIVKGVNVEVSKLFGDNSNKAIKMIIDVLKDPYEGFVENQILKSPLLLAFLLSFDKSSGLEYFFRNYKVDGDFGLSFTSDRDYFMDEFDKYFQWDVELPLYTVFWRCDYFGVKKKSILGESLYNIYCMIKNENVFELPEGIKLVNRNYRVDFPVIKKIRDNAQGKTVVMPDSLESIDGNLFRNIKINSLILNEGLIYVDDVFFEGLELDSIVIPSTLRRFPNINPKEMSCISFLNFENSYILNNEDELRWFIKNVFELVRPSFAIWRKYNIELLVKNLIFYSEDKKIVITYQDFWDIEIKDFEGWWGWYYRLPSNKYNATEIIANRLLKIIQRESGHKLPHKILKIENL